MEHGHVPYVVLLIKILNEWRSEHQGMAPETFQEKMDFKNYIKSLEFCYFNEFEFFRIFKKFCNRRKFPRSIKKLLQGF